MKCKRCDGDGVIIYYDYQYADKEVCPDCDGTGIVEPLTEQEWLQTADTEQLAEALLNIMANNEFTLYLLHTGKKSVQEMKDAVVEWLKQPHNSPK